ncbi:t-SNARE [Rhodocollybia butyracea]|uniref:t-SNARE n=1 Tax=Rhodocollybia butyracea TaxID=206335 RepID=A0A9P5PPR9_9AGAR|nr:t-SNARE [Rhodocollybia butyracea]
MARDRLAALRAQRQGASHLNSDTHPTQASENTRLDQDADYEMAQLRDSGNLSSFYAEISSLQNTLRIFNENVSRIAELHLRSLDNTNDVAAQRDAVQLNELVTDTSALSATLKRKIKELEKSGGSGRDLEIKKQQTALVKSKFVEAIQNYQHVEQEFRTRYKQRLERHDIGSGQMFNEALLDSNRHGEYRAVYREVQERQEDIKQIERTLGELAQLFNDMSVITEQQNETIGNVETTAGDVAHQTEAGGLGHTERAVRSARSARKMRWYCFFIFLFVVAVLAIVLGVVFGTRPKNH